MPQVYFDLPAEDLEAVDAIADRRHDGNRSEVLRQAVADYLHGGRSTGATALPGGVMTPPHDYVPPGPLDRAPRGPFQEPRVRLEALAAVLASVGLGAYDQRLITWLTDLDDPTCQGFASIMWRCRQAGLPPGGEAR